MTNTDLFMELLDDIFPNAYCDDCLSKELKIQPRQQINQLGRRLESDGKIIRKKGSCFSCKKVKFVNAINKPNTPLPTHNSDTVPENPTAYVVPFTSSTQNFDIEHVRTQIARICHQIWKDHKQDVPPRSISSVITTLRNEYFLPTHQANMMLTLCGLRNVHVYENMQMGSREMDIAKNAWSIIEEWWSNLKR